MPLLVVFFIVNIISGIIAIILGIYAFRFRHTGYQITLSILFFFVAWWDFGTAYESMQNTLQDHITWVALTYPAMMFSPLFLFLFLYQYTHINSTIRRLPFYLLLIIPVLTCIFVLFPQWRVFVWKDIALNTVPNGTIAHFEHGLWYYVAACYSYALLILGMNYLIRSFSQFPRRYTWQVRLLLLSSLFPLVANIIYTVNSEYLLGLDITPVALTVMTILFFIAIYKYKLLQMRPIARTIVIENINEEVIVIDNDNVIIDCNRAANEMLNPLGMKKAVGLSMHDCFADCRELDDFLQNEGKDKSEIVLLGHNYEITKRRMLHQSGKLSGQIVVFHDITDIKRKEEEITAINQQLKNANEIKDFLFKVVSHDLKGPIGNIDSMMKYLIENYKDKADYRQDLQVLHKASANVYQLLENILHWANCQQNELPLRPEVHFLSKTISQACEVIRYQANEKNIAIQVMCDDKTIAFYDTTTIEIVIRNLLSNAIKFSHKNESVDIVAEATDKNAVVKIVDRGTGMQEATIQCLQKNAVLKPQPGTMKEKGTGIGLYICQNLVKANNGRLKIESKLNYGTTVTIILPVD
jgi:signal transduction histidine kinase